MNAESFSQWLGSLSLASRAKALVRIGFELTICVREYGVPVETEQSHSSAAKKWRGVNELQHKLLSQASLYLDGQEEKVYPVDVLANALFEVAEWHVVSPCLRTAISSVQRKDARTAS